MLRCAMLPAFLLPHFSFPAEEHVDGYLSIGVYGVFAALSAATPVAAGLQPAQPGCREAPLYGHPAWAPRPL